MAWSSPRTWVTNEVVTAAHMNQEVRDNLNAGFPDAVSAASWTPTLQATTTDPSTSSVSGREYVVGALQFVWVRFVLSAGGGGDPEGGGAGTYFVTLPSTAAGLIASGSSGQAIGTARLVDASASSNRSTATVLLASLTTVQFGRANGANVTDSAPFSWESGDTLTFHAVYPIA